MHDVLEGALELEVKLLLKHFVGKKCVSLSTLNDAIESFPYGGADASNKPSPISSKILASYLNNLVSYALYYAGPCTLYTPMCAFDNLVSYYPRSITNVLFGQTVTIVYWRIY